MPSSLPPCVSPTSSSPPFLSTTAVCGSSAEEMEGRDCYMDGHSSHSQLRRILLQVLAQLYHCSTSEKEDQGEPSSSHPQAENEPLHERLGEGGPTGLPIEPLSSRMNGVVGLSPSPPPSFPSASFPSSSTTYEDGSLPNSSPFSSTTTPHLLPSTSPSYLTATGSSCSTSLYASTEPAPSSANPPSTTTTATNATLSPFPSSDPSASFSPPPPPSTPPSASLPSFSSSFSSSSVPYLTVECYEYHKQIIDGCAAGIESLYPYLTIFGPCLLSRIPPCSQHSSVRLYMSQQLELLRNPYLPQTVVEMEETTPTWTAAEEARQVLPSSFFSNSPPCLPADVKSPYSSPVSTAATSSANPQQSHHPPSQEVGNFLGGGGGGGF